MLPFSEAIPECYLKLPVFYLLPMCLFHMLISFFLSTYFSVLKSSRAFSNILLNDIHIEMVVLFSGAVSSFSPGNLTNAVR